MKPTGLTEATTSKNCASCQYFEKGLCLLYDYPVDSNDFCLMYMPIFLSNTKAIPKKYAHINFKPPKSVQTTAKRALNWRSEFGRGGTAVGIARARDLANGKQLSPQTIKRMVSFFARHKNNRAQHFKLEDGKPSTWRIAWDLWGGDPGESWANKVNRQMQSADN